MDSYKNLKKIMQRLDGSEKDLIEENTDTATYATLLAVLLSMPPTSNSQDSTENQEKD